jgi:hypothetical protein
MLSNLAVNYNVHSYGAVQMLNNMRNGVSAPEALDLSRYTAAGKACQNNPAQCTH